MNNRQNSTESTAELSPQQAEVITALVRGTTITDATKLANVDRTTFYFWLKSDATFEAELNRAKQEQSAIMRARLRGLADRAISTLEEMLGSKDIPPGVRLRAALAVLLGADTLDALANRLPVNPDTTVDAQTCSAAELLASRLARLAERSSNDRLSCEGSVG